MKTQKKEKKRALITVTAEPYEKLRAKLKAADFKSNYLSEQIDFLIQALLPVVEQAEIDAKLKKQMTIAQMEERYGNIASEALKKEMKK